MIPIKKNLIKIVVGRWRNTRSCIRSRQLLGNRPRSGFRLYKIPLFYCVLGRQTNSCREMKYHGREMKHILSLPLNYNLDDVNVGIFIGFWFLKKMDN